MWERHGSKKFKIDMINRMKKNNPPRPHEGHKDWI